MPLIITELHPAPPNAPEALNHEWLVLENQGTAPFNAKGCTIAVSRPGQRPREVGKLDPGFVLAPGGRMRLVTGNPAARAQGTPPDGDGLTNYYLFLRGSLFETSGVTVHLTLRQLDLAHATWDGAPSAPIDLATAIPPPPAPIRREPEADEAEAGAVSSPAPARPAERPAAVSTTATTRAAAAGGSTSAARTHEPAARPAAKKAPAKAASKPKAKAAKTSRAKPAKAKPAAKKAAAKTKAAAKKPAKGKKK